MNSYETQNSSAGAVAPRSYRFLLRHPNLRIASVGLGFLLIIVIMALYKTRRDCKYIRDGGHFTMMTSISGVRYACGQKPVLLRDATQPDGTAILSWRARLIPTMLPIPYVPNTANSWTHEDNLQAAGYGKVAFTNDINGRVSIVALVGKGTAFTLLSSGVPPDGVPNSAVVLIETEKAINHWMAPGDLDVSCFSTVPGGSTMQLIVGNPSCRGFHVAFSDWSVALIDSSIPVAQFMKLATVEPGTENDRVETLGKYWLLEER